MKEFPRFTESQITLDLKQPHLKIIFASLQALLSRLDVEMSPGEFKSFLDDTEKRQGIKFASELTQNQAAFKIEVENASSALMDAYLDKKMFYVDMVISDLNEHFDEHYDREIFDLAKGETLKIADAGSVYG
jgi:hypothetical protein